MYNVCFKNARLRQTSMDRVWQLKAACRSDCDTGYDTAVCQTAKDPRPSAASVCGDVERLIDTVLHNKSSSAREIACQILVQHIKCNNLGDLPASATHLLPCLVARISQPGDEEQLVEYLRLVTVLPTAHASVADLLTATAHLASHPSPAVVEVGCGACHALQCNPSMICHTGCPARYAEAHQSRLLATS